VLRGTAIIGGFFVLMIGCGIVLDTVWNRTGAAVALAGAVLLAWGALLREEGR
jgi:hypothetical protein